MPTGALDSAEVLVGANGAIYVAPTTGTAPTNATGALAAEWFNLGYADENGVTLRDGKTIQNVEGWQSFYPLRRLITARDFSVSFALLQWDYETVKLAFGGGTVTGSGGTYKYVPPDPATLDSRSLVVDWLDGARLYRVYIPSGIVTDNVETNVVRRQEARLPITFSVTPATGVDPWDLFVSDAAFSAS